METLLPYKKTIQQLKSSVIEELSIKNFCQLLFDDNVDAQKKASLLSFIELRKLNLLQIEFLVNLLLSKTKKPFFTNELCIDVCGTGGDGKNTINISTLSALIVASAGVKVVKHGNYGFTSINGSSGVLEYLGYEFKSSNNLLKEEFENYNIAFLHAPLFHPLLKSVSQTRKNIEFRSIFNLLGPMLNPMQPNFRLTGVSNPLHAQIYNQLYRKKNIQHNIIYSLDGNDEISLTAPFKVYSNIGEKLYHPKEFYTKTISQYDLMHTGTMKSAAEKFLAVLNNSAKKTTIHAVCTNAAFALVLANNIDFKLAFEIVYEQIQNKKALLLLNNLIKIKNVKRNNNINSREN